jgi:glycosyltransferase involved in cell wall biosynthesis
MSNQDSDRRSCIQPSGGDRWAVTIVIPTYNRAKMLLRAIRSIQKQTFADWRLFVVDNASSDNTTSLVEEAMRGDDRIRYHRHPENIGMLANWEFALSRVESRFFCLLCDDDYVLPGFLQTAMNEMGRHPDIGLCFGRAAVVDNDGRRLGEAPTKMATGYYEAGRGAAAMLKEQNPATPATLFRSDCAKSVGWFDQRSQYVADLDMILRVALQYPILFFEEEVACYVVHSGNSFKDISGWHPGLLNLIRNIKKIEISDESYRSAIFESLRNHAILPLFYQPGFYQMAIHKPYVVVSALQCLMEIGQFLNTIGLFFAHATRRLLGAVFRRIKKLTGRIILLFAHAAQGIIHRFGYELVKQGPPMDPVVDQTPVYDQDGLRTEHCAAFMRDGLFLEAYAAGEATGSWSGAAVHWRAHVACWLAERASHLGGDLIECGVNRGGMARAIVAYLGPRLQERHFYLLDTYEGIPESILSERESRHQAVFQQVYTECFQEVLNTFRPFPEVVVVKGLVPSTFERVDSNQFCFVHIDMNNAQSEIAAAEYLWPRLVAGGFMLLDDYGWQISIDQRAAFNQFAQERGLTVLALPTGQGLLMKV